MTQAAKIITDGLKEKLRNRAAEFAPLLELTGEWSIRDIDEDPHDFCNTMHTLKQAGAIVHQGKEIVPEQVKDGQPNQGTEIVNKWSWSGPHKRYLQEVLQNRQTMPECLHRVHICNPREVDGFSCRKCNDQGEYPEYSRETIEELL